MFTIELVIISLTTKICNSKDDQIVCFNSKLSKTIPNSCTRIEFFAKNSLDYRLHSVISIHTIILKTSYERFSLNLNPKLNSLGIVLNYHLDNMKSNILDKSVVGRKLSDYNLTGTMPQALSNLTALTAL